MIARVGKKKDRDSGSGFKYRKRSADDVKKRSEQSGGNFDSPIKQGFDMWRPKAGENVIRILPPTWDDYEHYGYDVFMHRFIGSDTSNYICLNKMKGKRCPACDEAKLAKDGGEEDEAKALGFQKRCWVWIVDRDDKSLTPQVWDMSWAQDRDIAGLSYFKSGKVLLIDHPDDGYDIIVKKTGAGLKTKYHFNIERDASPISDDEEKQEEILQFITENPIPTVMNFFSAEHIAKKLEGTTEEKDKDLDGDDDDRRTKKAGKRSRVEDDEVEEEETPRRKRKPAEEEEDDEPPRRRRREEEEDDDPPKKKRRVEEEEDDEPPKKKRRPAEEEEDDEPPKKRRRVEEEEDDEPPKKKKRREEEEEDDDPPPKKKRRVEEEEDDEPPKKKRRAVEEEEDDEPPKKKRRREEDDD